MVRQSAIKRKAPCIDEIMIENNLEEARFKCGTGMGYGTPDT